MSNRAPPAYWLVIVFRLPLPYVQILVVSFNDMASIKPLKSPSCQVSTRLRDLTRPQSQVFQCNWPVSKSPAKLPSLRHVSETWHALEVKSFYIFQYDWPVSKSPAKLPSLFFDIRDLTCPYSQVSHMPSRLDMPLQSSLSHALGDLATWQRF